MGGVVRACRGGYRSSHAQEKVRGDREIDYGGLDMPSLAFRWGRAALWGGSNLGNYSPSVQYTQLLRPRSTMEHYVTISCWR